MDWGLYFEWLDTRRDKMDFYLAQIAGYCSQQGRWKVKQFFAPSPNDNCGRHVVSAKDALKIVKAMYG